MFALLLFLFIIVPIVEVALLIKVGQLISLGPTLAIIILTGVLGAALARRQGLNAMTRIQSELSQGRMPTSELADGFLILAAGILLVTPGLLTDAVGLSLLTPLGRRGVRSLLRGHFNTRIVLTHPYEAGVNWSGVGPTSRESSASSNEDEQFEPVPPGGRPMKYVRNEAADDPHA